MERLSEEQIARLMNVISVGVNRKNIVEVMLAKDKDFIIKTKTETITIAIALKWVEFVMNGIDLRRDEK